MLMEELVGNGNGWKGVMDVWEKGGGRIEGMGLMMEKGLEDGGDLVGKEGMGYEGVGRVERVDDWKIVLK